MKTIRNTTRVIALGAFALFLACVPAMAIVGGALPEHGAPQGFFVEPTLLYMNFRDVDQDFAIFAASTPGCP